MRAAWIPVVLFVVSACIPMYQPGQGVTPAFAAQWGCKYEDIMIGAEQYAAQLPAGQVYIPQVGWNACNLLAHNGRPTRVDHQQTAYGRSASWWYHAQGSSEAHLVSLEYRDRRWIVDYVGW